MLYRNVPKNGDALSILGFGAMRLPLKEDGTIDEPLAIAQMRMAIDKGVNYLDTAWPYHGGMSEIVVGKAVQDGYREKVKIADKLPSWLVESRIQMDELLDKQLEKLGVEYIDYYLLHALAGASWDRLNLFHVQDFLTSAKVSGKVKNVGFSFHGLPDDFIRICDEYDWDFCQIQYNYLDQTNQAGTAGLRHAAGKGLAVIIMEPLRGGNLSRPEQPAPIQELWDKAEIKRSPAEWALRWIWNHPEVTVVLSGMNEEDHIEENLRIAAQGEANSFTQAEKDLVDQVAESYQAIMPIPCTGCAYCMPCPEGVRIPGCFELYNTSHMFPDKIEMAQHQYAMFFSADMGGASSYASQCIECGQCVEHCPQSIDIPAELKKVVERLDTGNIAERLAYLRGQSQT